MPEEKLLQLRKEFCCWETSSQRLEDYHPEWYRLSSGMAMNPVTEPLTTISNSGDVLILPPVGAGSHGLAPPPACILLYILLFGSEAACSKRLPVVPSSKVRPRAADSQLIRLMTIIWQRLVGGASLQASCNRIFSDFLVPVHRHPSHTPAVPFVTLRAEAAACPCPPSTQRDGQWSDPVHDRAGLCPQEGETVTEPWWA